MPHEQVMPSLQKPNTHTHPPRIHAHVPRVQIMPSLQKPKKVTLLGSDGREYPFLAKPKDDLRKDYRCDRADGGEMHK